MRRTWRAATDGVLISAAPGQVEVAAQASAAG